jgi:hypothetical protein
MLENRVLRRIFGLKREEVTRGWRKLHNKKLCNLYASPHVIRVIKLGRIRCSGHVAGMGEMRNAYNTLIGIPERKRTLRRCRCR